MARCVGRIKEWQLNKQIVVEGLYVVGYVNEGIWSVVPGGLVRRECVLQKPGAGEDISPRSNQFSIVKQYGQEYVPWRIKVLR